MKENTTEVYRPYNLESIGHESIGQKGYLSMTTTDYTHELQEFLLLSSNRK